MFLPDLRARLLLLPAICSCTASRGVLQHVGLLSAYRAIQPSQPMTADACLVLRGPRQQLQCCHRLPRGSRPQVAVRQPPDSTSPTSLAYTFHLAAHLLCMLGSLSAEAGGPRLPTPWNELSLTGSARTCASPQLQTPPPQIRDKG